MFFCKNKTMISINKPKTTIIIIYWRFIRRRQTRNSCQTQRLASDTKTRVRHKDSHQTQRLTSDISLTAPDCLKESLKNVIFSPLSVTTGQSSAAPSIRKWTTSWRRRSLWPGPLAATTLVSASLPNISWIKTPLCLWVIQLFVVESNLSQQVCWLAVLSHRVSAPQAKVNNASLIGVGYTQSLRPGRYLITVSVDQHDSRCCNSFSSSHEFIMTASLSICPILNYICPQTASARLNTFSFNIFSTNHHQNIWFILFSVWRVQSFWNESWSLHWLTSYF